MKFVRLVRIFVRQKLLRRDVGRNMVLIAVEAVPGGSKSPASDGSMRTSTGGRCGFRASVPSLTRALPMHFLEVVKRGSAIMPKLVKLVGPSSTLAEKAPQFFLSSAAALIVRLLVVVSVLRLPPWRDVAAKLPATGLLNADLSCFSPPCLQTFHD